MGSKPSTIKLNENQCSVCNGVWTELRQLPCSHNSCTKCIENWTCDLRPGDQVTCKKCGRHCRVEMVTLLITKDQARIDKERIVEEVKGELKENIPFDEEIMSQVKPEERKAFLENSIDSWKAVPIKIAVIGRSGVGKSSFINAIRGIKATHEDAAKVGVIETTRSIKSYPHKTNKMLVFDDLPGVGTESFPKETYLSVIDVDKYDFFLVLTADRFYEDDAWLASECKKRNKGFFFVRTKISIAIMSDKYDKGGSHDEQKVLKTIKDDIMKNLGDDATVFLIDSHEKKFEFQTLEKNIINNFPSSKRAALILSLPCYSEEMVRCKVQELRAKAWLVAGMSGVVAAVPLPGVSFAFDVPATIRMCAMFREQLGLTNESVQNLAELLKIDASPLLKNSNLEALVFSEQTLVALVKTVPQVAAMVVAEHVFHWVPVVGSFISSPLSFIGTYMLLNQILKLMENEAYKILRLAFGR